MKKQTWSKIITLIISIMLVCSMCLTASAQDGKEEFEIEGTKLVKYNGWGGEVTVPEGIEVLGEWAFEGKAVTKVTLPETLQEIENYCFFGCKKLTEITLPASLKTLGGMQSFAYNTSLEAINVAEGNPYFVSVDGVLFDETKTRLLYYPCGRNKGGEYAIPEGTRYIGPSSMEDTGLTAIELPSTLTDLHYTNEFSGNSMLKEIRVAEGNPIYRSVDGMLFDTHGTLLCYPSGREQETLTPKDFPAEMKTIAPYAFQNAEYLKNITIPDGITSIQWMCFTFSDRLESVTVPESVTSIEGYAFADCPNLKQVVILNPNADIVLHDSRFPDRKNVSIVDCSPNAVIYGYENSTAQAYAKGCGAEFEVLSSEQDPNRNLKIDAFITRCYQNILGREATASELNNWYADLYSGKKTAAEIVDQFAAGNEFKSRHLSFADMVEILCNTMLGRPAEQAEKTGWVNMLKNGQRLKSVLNSITTSEEYVTLCKNCGMEPGVVKVPVIIK